MNRLLLGLLCWVLWLPALSWAGGGWPTTHPEHAVYQRLTPFDAAAVDAYFWWEDGSLWQEVIPVTTGPYVCSAAYRIVQQGVESSVTLIQENGEGFCFSLYLKTVLKVVAVNGGPYSNQDSTLYFQGASLTAIPIPKTGELPPQTHALQLTVTGLGAVTSEPAGIDCGAVCNADFAQGAAVNLTAIPGSGQTFGGWSGSCSGTGACLVIMDGIKSVAARFDAATTPTYALNLHRIGNGTVKSNPAGIDCGAVCSADFAADTPVTLTAVPHANYTFQGWLGACSGTAQCVLNMDGGKSLSATFVTALPRRNLTVTLTGLGTVVDPTGRIDCGNRCSAQYDKGAKVALSATPATGYHFKSWSGACTGRKACVVKMNSNRKVKAKFVRTQ